MKLRTEARVLRSELVAGRVPADLMTEAHTAAFSMMAGRCAGQGYAIRGKVYFTGLTDAPDDADRVVVNFECETTRRT